jgi:hypothetical protein
MGTHNSKESKQQQQYDELVQRIKSIETKLCVLELQISVAERIDRDEDDRCHGCGMRIYGIPCSDQLGNPLCYDCK